MLAARLVVLLSGTGTNLAALLEACADPHYGATVVAVGSDRVDAPGLGRATDAGIPTFVCRPATHAGRDDWDRALAGAVAAFDPDLVVLAGFMRLVGPAVLERFPGRLVNTHPALLPAFPGAQPVRDTLAYGTKITGATIHLVDAGIDTGPVVAQVAVTVHDGDDETRLHERIKVAERELLVQTVGRMVRAGWTLNGRRVTIP